MMDQQVIMQIAAVGAWLWPVIAPGAQTFIQNVGEGLGNAFVSLIGNMINATRQREGQQKINQTGYDDEKIKELLSITLRNSPRSARALREAICPAFKKLLKNPDYFTEPEVRFNLIPNLGYQVSKFVGPAVPTDELVNLFVDQVWADRKIERLVNAIQEMKPDLFTPED